MSQTSAVDFIEDKARQFSRTIRHEFPAIETAYQRALRKAGFDPNQSAALSRTTPIAAARMLLSRKALTKYWQDVGCAGRDLARMNVSPTQVSEALRLSDEIASRLQGFRDFSEVWQQLKFSTILVLNEAYHDVREQENQAFHQLLNIEMEASNTDVLLRGMLESIANSCSADAAHAFLLAGEGAFWGIRASTATAANSQTSALVNATGAIKRALTKPRLVENPEQILDAGWRGKYASIWSVPLRDAGVFQLAFTQERNLLPREIELLSSACDRCFVAIRKTRQLEDIAEHEARLRKLAIRMLMVEENERRRIGRELHDDAGQSLVVIRLQMELIEQLLVEKSEERERLAEVRDITEKAILDIRRLIADLSPAVLEQLGLGAGLRQLTNRFRSRYACEIAVDVGQLCPLETNFQLVVYRLTQECLNNISEHSQATRVNISVSTADSVLRLEVEDNGTGFDVDQALERKNAFGLIGIRERVAVLGGTVVILSTRKEGQPSGKRKKSGTVIRIQLPIR